MLTRLLRKLAEQETNGAFGVSLVVVDNDPVASARTVVDKIRGELNVDIIYGVGRENTIPSGRNHALRLARGNYIAIIDDDEFPPKNWLLTLYRAIRTFEVDGALGPVHPYFEQTPPRWLVKSGFCERPVHRTGTLLHWTQTRTGNVLLKKEVFDKDNLEFDESMRTGGTDREFFKHAMRFGRRFVAVEEAPVYEIVPPERWKKSYYVKRALVNGFNAHRNSRGEAGIKRVITPLKSIVASLAYAAATPFTAVLGTHALMSCLVRGGHHFSRVCAIAGFELVKKRDF